MSGRETVERLVDEFEILQRTTTHYQHHLRDKARTALLAHFQQLEADLTHEHLRRDAAEGECIDCQVALKELEDRLAGAERDAARYRYLKSRAHQNTAYDIYQDGGQWLTGCQSKDYQLSLDAAIDAALAASGAQQKGAL